MRLRQADGGCRWREKRAVGRFPRLRCANAFVGRHERRGLGRGPRSMHPSPKNQGGVHELYRFGPLMTALAFVLSPVAAQDQARTDLKINPTDPQPTCPMWHLHSINRTGGLHPEGARRKAAGPAGPRHRHRHRQGADRHRHGSPPRPSESRAFGAVLFEFYRTP